MARYLFLSVAWLAFICQQSRAQLTTPKESDWDIPQYVVSRAHTVKIDGLANEIAWQAAATISFAKRDGSELEDLSPTLVKLLHDETHVYILATLYDLDIRASIDTQDSDVYLDNAFELFIDPDGDMKNYIELQINAVGSICDLRMNQPYRSGGRSDKTFDLADLEYAIAIDGTLNAGDDQDTSWTIEMALPKTSITKGSTTTPWRVQVARSHWHATWQDGVYVRDTIKPEFTCWAPTHSKSLHRPEKWARVYFDSIPEIADEQDNYFRAMCLAYDYYYQLRQPAIRRKVTPQNSTDEIYFFGKMYKVSYSISNKKYTIRISDAASLFLFALDEMGNNIK